MTYHRLLEPPQLIEDQPVNRLTVHSVHSDRLMDICVLGLILSGEVALCIGEQEGSVGVGQFYFMPSHLRHYGTAESKFEVIYFHFRAQCQPCDALETGALPVLGTMPTHLNAGEWFEFLRSSDDFGLMNEPSWNLHLSALLNQLHLASRRLQNLNLNEKLLGIVFDYLRDHVTVPLNQAHLSSAIGYSYDHLDRLFRSRFGTTIYRRHSELRFEQAVALIQTGYSLKETARTIGFDDYYHFLKAFKRVKGCSAGQFQRTGRF